MIFFSLVIFVQDNIQKSFAHVSVFLTFLCFIINFKIKIQILLLLYIEKLMLNASVYFEWFFSIKQKNELAVANFGGLV